MSAVLQHLTYGAMPFGYCALRVLMKADMAKWAKVIKAANIRIEN